MKDALKEIWEGMNDNPLVIVLFITMLSFAFISVICSILVLTRPIDSSHLESIIDTPNSEQITTNFIP